jgi:hypothetical protein
VALLLLDKWYVRLKWKFCRTVGNLWLTLQVDQELPFWEYGLCEGLDEDFFAARGVDVQNLGGAYFVTEFGLCNGQDQAGQDNCNMVMSRFVL